ncbi:Kelch repeat-containing protein [Lignipirellula cremea]|uniref:N-acetylneuraminate epimerase n=1 Tax=Lignipirellula cremea TaxID=2528010 RepID=A0A518DXB0_9BACT|nr:hypothetical protein [Lignipirellula cremea]QDU96478.1 N-acetylneuraminate epimerase precursor [Lignipirellula cremea]
MMSRRLVWSGVLLAMLIAPQIAHAHFLWLVGDSPSNPTGVKVYFSEGPEADDPDLLDRVVAAECWVGSGRGGPSQVELKKGEESLVGSLDANKDNTTVFLRHTYGVITRGGKPFLLHYYGKAYTTPLPGNWNMVNDQERLPLEVSASPAGEETRFKVTFNGKPAAGAALTIDGPGMKETEGVADEQGVFRCALPETGLFAIRAKLVEQEKGEHEGAAYEEVRHYSTLTLRRAPSVLKPLAAKLPELPQGTTSMGAAVAGDVLFVYGGNYGSAHEYSNEDQSGDLWKLDLKKAGKWEKVSQGPRLQGLAMVEHQGLLYRVGGFTAMNAEGEKQNLQSQASFARFDPKSGEWTDLPDLPRGRSSHDAAVVGDTLYVVGGWTLQGDKDSAWHDTALAFDLSAKDAQWKEIANPPFKRRAIALAASNGKLVCIGGMREDGGPTRETSIYDPASDSWTAGPLLQGGGLEGFGASAFATQDGLYVTTISGSIQRLSDDGKTWEYVGQVKYPRFFHRMVPYQDQLVIVGGASMTAGGKVEDVELLGR